MYLALVYIFYIYYFYLGLIYNFLNKKIKIMLLTLNYSIYVVIYQEVQRYTLRYRYFKYGH